MKGVKTMSVANATSKRFQSNDILAERIHLPGNIEVTETINKLLLDNKQLLNTVKELSLKLKELEDKINLFETE